MAHVRTGDVADALKKKGFKEDDGKKRHVFFRLYTDDGKTAITTMMSRGSRSEDLRSELIGRMSSQLNLNKQEFLDLVKCPLSKEDLIKILTDRGKLP